MNPMIKVTVIFGNPIYLATVNLKAPSNLLKKYVM